MHIQTATEREEGIFARGPVANGYNEGLLSHSFICSCVNWNIEDGNKPKRKWEWVVQSVLWSKPVRFKLGLSWMKHYILTPTKNKETMSQTVTGRGLSACSCCVKYGCTTWRPPWMGPAPYVRIKPKLTPKTHHICFSSNYTILTTCL